jgi:DNA processing protein
MASGTMITVDQALEQGRAVMAVPGRVDSPTSQGCHKLIRNGARLVTCADDVIDELGTFLPSSRPADGKLHLETEAPLQRPANAPSLSEEEQRIIDAIGGAERFVDDLVAATGIEAGRLNGLLVALQIKRFVKLLPGGVVIAGKRE